MISTSEIKVSCIIEQKNSKLAVNALHDAFNMKGKPGKMNAKRKTAKKVKAV
jgi:hypothetical protein